MKVSKEQIILRIANIQYMIIDDSTVTICNITLDNGFSVRGESACVDPKEFKAEIGREIAYENAFSKLWPLFGFLLAEDLHQGRVTADA